MSAPWSSLFLAASALAATSLRAEVKLPAILSDNMVVQAQTTVPVWGTASPQEKVVVTFAGQSQSTQADSRGHWRVNLAPLPLETAGEMTIAGQNTLIIKNVLVGEVWLASGQSNMGLLLSGAHNAATEIPAANYPRFRQFKVIPNADLLGHHPLQGQWVACSPTSASDFTAVGYFFAKEIHLKTGRAVGLISDARGGTPAQAWTSLSGLKKDEALASYVSAVEPYLKDPAQIPVKLEKDLAQWQGEMARYDARLKKDQAYQSKLKEWEGLAAAAKAEKKPLPPKPLAPLRAPLQPKPIDSDQCAPTTLFNGMIEPLIPYAIRGVIWYQGESNARQPVEYRTLFARMITDWREHWQQGDFPFYFVQLANYLPREDKPTDPNWAWLREAQTMTLKLPNTAMALAIDVGQGDDIHPRNKMDVGLRLARHALKNQYGQNLVTSGPTFKEMKLEGSRLRLSFSDLGSGLTIGSAPSTQPGVAPEKPLPEVIGFAVAGEDHRWVWAKATIEGSNVMVWSDEVAKPIAVRYAWANNPACNLYNLEGLPAVPFRSDDWPQMQK